MRRIFASGFPGRFVLSFRWIPSELTCSEKRSRFFVREYDPSKSLLRVLAQRLTRFSSFAPVTFCRPPQGLVGLQFLDESQMQWSSAGRATESCHARSPAKVYENCPNDSGSGHSSRRQATVDSESLSEICAPVPDEDVGVLSEECQRVSRSWHAKLREYKASPQAKRRTAKPATQTGLYRC